MRYLGADEKDKSRKLWEQVFDEDTPAFLDYYYTYKTKDNEILVQEEKGEIISMVHRNPFQMYLKGAGIPAEYIVAVATREDRRSRGHMRRLLQRSMQDAHAAGIPFQFLMPAAEAIYTPYGFRYVTKRPEKIVDTWSSCGLTEREVDANDLQELASFVNISLADNGGLFVQRDKDYFVRLKAERECEGGGLRVLYDERGLLTGYYAFYGGEEDVITEAVFRPGFRDTHMKELLAAMKTTVAGKGDRPVMEDHMMARITHLLMFLRCFTIPTELLDACEVPEGSSGPGLYLDVADLVIPENHGHFYWYFRESRSHLVRLDKERRTAMKESGYPQVPAVRVDIADLGSWLFGYRPFDELVEEGLIVGPEESLNLLRKVRPLQHIYIREEV